MGFQCVPQTLGLTRAEKSPSKNKTNGKAILEEMGEERYSKSTTLDKSLSYLNEYEGYRSGGECWDAIVAEADEYRSTYTDKNGKERSRRIPQKSVVAVATIIHPPMEVTATWDEETWAKWDADSDAVLEAYDDRIYSPKNNRMRAKHKDEGGEHLHRVDMPRDADDRFCGNVYDAQWRQGLAKFFAEQMRERGWEVDDPDLTDWDKFNELREAQPDEEDAFTLEKPKQGFEAGTLVTFANPEYRAKIKAKREKQGLSQPEYSAQQQQEMAEKMEQAARDLSDAVDAVATAKAEQAEAEQQRDKAIKERNTAHAYRDMYAGHSYTAKDGRTVLGVEGMEARLGELRDEIAALKARKAELETGVAEVEQTYTGIVRKAREAADARVDVSDIAEYAEEMFGDANPNAQAHFNRVLSMKGDDGRSPEDEISGWFGGRIVAALRNGLRKMFMRIMRNVEKDREASVERTHEQNAEWERDKLQITVRHDEPGKTSRLGHNQRGSFHRPQDDAAPLRSHSPNRQHEHPGLSL